MNSHLVSIEIGVEGRADKRMEFYGLTLYKDRLKGLYSKPVKRRGTVKHYRMLFDNILEYVPYLRLKTLDHLFGCLYIVCRAILHKLLHDERLEQLYRHFLRKSALVDLKLRSNYYNRTS